MLTRRGGRAPTRDPQNCPSPRAERIVGHSAAFSRALALLEGEALVSLAMNTASAAAASHVLDLVRLARERAPACPGCGGPLEVSRASSAGVLGACPDCPAIFGGAAIVRDADVSPLNRDRRRAA